MSLYPWKWFSFEVVQDLARRRDIDVATQDYDYSPLTGLNLYGANARIPLPAGEALFTASKINIQLDRDKLVSRTYWCNGIEIRDAGITFDLQPAREKVPDDEEPPEYIEYDAKRPRFQPDALVLTNANLSLRQPGTKKPTLQVEGLSAVLEKPTLSSHVDNPFAALIAHGTIKSGTLRYGAKKYSGLAGRFRLINGVVSLDRLELSSKEGRHHLSGIELNLGTAPPTMKADLDSDLTDARFLFSELGIWPDEPVPGKLKCKLSGTLSGLTAAGTLSLAARTLQPRKLPVFAELSQLFLDDKGPLTAQGDWVLPFKFTAPFLDLGKALLRTDRLSLELEGHLRPKNVMAVQADVLVPIRDLPGSFPIRIVPALKAASTDEVRILFEVNGTRQALRRDKRLTKDDIAELDFFLRSRTVFTHQP